MLQLARWKIILVALAAAIGLLFAAPNLIPASTLSSLPGWLPKKTLNLGLDLQGGASLLMEVDTADLISKRTTKTLEDIRNSMAQEEIAISGLTQTSNTSIALQVTDAGKVDAALRLINQIAQPNVGQVGSVREFDVQREGQQITLRQRDEGIAAATTRAVDQSLEVIRRRVDALGTREPTIMRQGANRIIVQAPGESDPERLKNVIGKTARLTFQMVEDSVSAEEAAAGLLPPGSELLPSDDNPAGIVVRRREIVTGDQLTRASATFDQQNQPVVLVSFDSQGARAFGRVTTENVGKSFAIILDDRVISVARIIEPIPGGNGQITMGGQISEANDLALQLNAGALPAKLTVEEQRAVTAELGSDAVNAGKTATIVAFVGVLVFMVFAYGVLFGGISVVALLVNGVLIIAAMSATEATLTLPGIAGLILTLAMAVDANVLIYERMRDEVRAGKTAIMAMEAGFSRAMVTIVDANLTTLIAAWIMFFFGAGPVRGFAWTLSIGVLTSVFTAVLITQVLLAVWFRVRRPKTLPIA